MLIRSVNLESHRKKCKVHDTIFDKITKKMSSGKHQSVYTALHELEKSVNKNNQIVLFSVTSRVWDWWEL